jgi:ATP-dependent protease ClpP protease subunit
VKEPSVQGEQATTPAAGSKRPVKTPLYQAMHADRYARQEIIRKIQKITGNLMICYVAGQKSLVNRDDTLGIVEVLHNIPRDSNLDFLLHTAGGDIDAAEKIVSIVRTVVGKGQLRIIVPDFAKSAGTLIALAADKIVMSDSSELGPIDPQIVLSDGRGNSLQHSVMSYLDAFKKHTQALRDNPDDIVAQMMLNKLDPATVNLLDAVRQRAQKLAEQHLNRWMFHEKKATYTKIAYDLMDTARWLTHGQMIGYQEAQSLELEVEYLLPDSDEWRLYWQLYCMQRLAVKDDHKLFESEYASLPIDGALT